MKSFACFIMVLPLHLSGKLYVLSVSLHIGADSRPPICQCVSSYCGRSGGPADNLRGRGSLMHDDVRWITKRKQQAVQALNFPL